MGYICKLKFLALEKSRILERVQIPKYPILERGQITVALTDVKLSSFEILYL